MATRLRDDDPARALDALHSIDAGAPRDEWLRAAMGAKAAGVTEADFIEWSAAGGNYSSERDCRSVWRSIKSGPVGAATLFGMARDAGWRDSGPRTNHARVLPSNAAASLQKPAGRPAFDFAAVWEGAEPASAAHPYVEAKLGLPDGLRVYRGPVTVAGQSLDGALLVPAYAPDGSLATWQEIPAESGGRKLNAPGRPMAGTFIVGGPVRAGEVAYVCEGIGAAWSAHQATRKPAVVSFGSTRMQQAAQSLVERFPGALPVLVADVGQEGPCEAVAAAVGGSWVGLPAGWPANADVNDLHQRNGLGAVAALMAAAQMPETKPASGMRAIPAPEFASGISTPEYMLDGVFQRGFVYALTGPTGSGKTAVALALAACMALGRDFAGRETSRSSVLYVASENPDDVRARVLAWCAHSGVRIEELGERLHFVDESFTLEAREADLHAAIESVGAALVILDTDQALAGSEDENSNSERIAHAKRVRALCRASSRPCVIDLCHPPAGAGRNTLRPRGGSAFLAEIDGNAGLWRDDGTELVEIFKGAKFRGPDFDSMVFELRTVAVDALRDSKGRPMQSVVAVPASAADDARLFREGRDRLLAVLRAVSLAPDASQRQRADSLDMPRTAVQRALLELVEGGALRKTLAGHEVTDKGKKWLVAAL
jgi:putative DNA primase/helicase